MYEPDVTYPEILGFHPNNVMTEREIELYRKCVKKKSKCRFRTRAEYEADHEYDISENEFNDRDR